MGKSGQSKTRFNCIWTEKTKFWTFDLWVFQKMKVKSKNVKPLHSHFIIFRRNLNDRLSNNEIGWLRFLIMRNWVSENKIVWLGDQDIIDLKLMLCRRERDFFSDQHSLSIIIIFIEEYQASDKILFGLVNDFLKKDLINGVTTDYLKPRQRTQHLKHF